MFSTIYEFFFIKGHNELYDLVDSYFSFWFDNNIISHSIWWMTTKKSQGWTWTLLTWTQVKAYQGLGCVCGCYLFHLFWWSIVVDSPRTNSTSFFPSTKWWEFMNFKHSKLHELVKLLWFSIVLLHGTCFYFNGDMMRFQLLWILVVV